MARKIKVDAFQDRRDLDEIREGEALGTDPFAGLPIAAPEPDRDPSPGPGPR